MTRQKQTLEALRARFQKDDTKETTEFTPNNYYPFWNMKENQQCKIRFVPDKNQDNPYGFIVHKLMHTLIINGEKKSVPCLSMYGEECPICQLSQQYYKNKDEASGKKYWRKKQYIAQALVLEDPLPADDKSGETHEGKLRFIAIGYQIYKIIAEAFKNPEILDSIPYDYEGGYDFIIKKTKGPKYDAYDVGTMFARRPRDLTDDELVVVEEAAVDLATLLPKNPGHDKVQAMLEAALTGSAYASEESEQDDLPASPPSSKKARPQLPLDDEEFAPTTKVTKPTPKKEEPVETASDNEMSVQDTLAIIRKRRAEQKEAQKA